MCLFNILTLSLWKRGWSRSVSKIREEQTEPIWGYDMLFWLVRKRSKVSWDLEPGPKATGKISSRDAFVLFTAVIIVESHCYLRSSPSTNSFSLPLLLPMHDTTLNEILIASPHWLWIFATKFQAVLFFKRLNWHWDFFLCLLFPSGCSSNTDNHLMGHLSALLQDIFLFVF